MTCILDTPRPLSPNLKNLRVTITFAAWPLALKPT